MSKRATSTPTSKRSQIVPVPRSLLIPRWLATSFVVTLGPLLILSALNIRFGQGYFAYRYSPVRDLRTIRALFCIPIAASAVASVYYLAAHRRIGKFLLLITLVLATLWLWFGPPGWLQQHAFNLRSMSTDGAFVT